MESRLLLTVFVLFAASPVRSHNLTDEETLKWVPSQDLLDNFPYYLSGHDDDGAPIWVYEFGQWDVRSYIEKGGDAYNKVDIYGDQMFLTFREDGRNTTGKQFIAIMDMDTWPFSQAGHAETVKFILSKFARFEQIARGGDMKQGYILNANFLWLQIWDLGKNLLGALANSIEIFGANSDKWKPKLLKHIPKDQLPEWYGGSKDHKPVRWAG